MHAAKVKGSAHAAPFSVCQDYKSVWQYTFAFFVSRKTFPLSHPDVSTFEKLMRRRKRVLHWVSAYVGLFAALLYPEDAYNRSYRISRHSSGPCNLMHAKPTARQRVYDLDNQKTFPKTRLESRYLTLWSAYLKAKLQNKISRARTRRRRVTSISTSMQNYENRPSFADITTNAPNLNLGREPRSRTASGLGIINVRMQVPAHVPYPPLEDPLSLHIPMHFTKPTLHRYQYKDSDTDRKFEAIENGFRRICD